MEPGQNLLHYRLIDKIGEGGMGVVWKALDTTLNREVAIKVLPAVVAQDTERLARFEREAKLLASLNHANIASVYGLHEDREIRFLAMEFVEGEDLLKRIGGGRIPLGEALGIARQVADAIQAAHERGVVHRDLKPANILITPEGKAKVLDFGLAKAFENDPSAPVNPSMSPTLTSHGTIAGVILGTAGYMSPEQARGGVADKRSDVWAFGVVLYEMVCGSRAFHGDTVSDTLASVLKLEPEWDSLPADLPRGVRRLLRRCLQKDPRQRLHDIADARIEIDEALAAPDEPPVVQQVATTAPPRTRWLLTAVLAFLALIAGLVVGRNLIPSAPEPPVRRFFIPLQADEGESGLTDVRISPDGEKISYVLGGKIWLRDLDSIDARVIEGTDGADNPVWSPDSTQLVFHVDNVLWRLPVDSAKPAMISEVKDIRIATWATAQTIAVNTGEELRELSARGGEPKIVHEVDPGLESDFHDLTHLPDGRGLLFVVHRKEGADTVAVWAEGERKPILQIEEAWLMNPTYASSGHILFTRTNRNEGIWAVPFSLADLEITGDPFLVVPGGNEVSVSDDGTLVCTDRSAEREFEFFWINAAGEVEGPVGQRQSGLISPALSPDGTRVAVSGFENDEWDIWVHDIVRGTKTRLTFTEGFEAVPHWSANGETILFHHPGRGTPKTIYRVPADGSGEPQAIVEGQSASFSADTKQMVFVREGDGTQDDLWTMNLEDPSSPSAFLQTDADEYSPALSPDGRFVAYVSEESGDQQVYIKPHPGGAGRWQASVDQGLWPRWSSTGDRLLFVAGSDLMQVSFSASPRVALGTPEVAVNGGETEFVTWRRFAMDPAGERILLVRGFEEEGAEPRIDGIHVVENWLGEFRD